MTDMQALEYVKASAIALGIDLDDARAKRVAVYFQLAEGFARQLEGTALVPELDPAEVFLPAPFPDATSSKSEGGR